MLNHASLPVTDLERSCALYDAALGALGYRRVSSARGFAGYGSEEGRDKFALMQVGRAASAGAGFHLAFAAPSRGAVDAFHRAALEAWQEGGVSEVVAVTRRDDSLLGSVYRGVLSVTDADDDTRLHVAGRQVIRVAGIDPVEVALW